LARTAARSFNFPTNGPTGKGIRDLETDGKTLYISTNSGIYTSANLGVSWRNISNPDSGVHGFIQSMAATQGEVSIDTELGLYRLSENGTSWIHSVLGANDSSVSSLFIKGDTTLAGTASGAIYRSLDKGLKWSRINPIGQTGRVFAFVLYLLGYPLDCFGRLIEVTIRRK
jgi:photosystem II stability/assembly factor-like uncharacterized protein